ncbi:hypothetical protein MMC31_006008, partial [Peltigera leucophlebia]|nr:hypothetical protein [Peltigera leucophlebia]
MAASRWHSVLNGLSLIIDGRFSMADSRWPRLDDREARALGLNENGGHQASRPSSIGHQAAAIKRPSRSQAIEERSSSSGPGEGHREARPLRRPSRTKAIEKALEKQGRPSRETLNLLRRETLKQRLS